MADDPGRAIGNERGDDQIPFAVGDADMSFGDMFAELKEFAKLLMILTDDDGLADPDTDEAIHVPGGTALLGIDDPVFLRGLFLHA